MDFNVTDFNVRLRTIRLREAVLAVAIGFILNVVLIAIFPPLLENDTLSIMPLVCFIALFFIWALRGTHGLRDDFSKLFERDNRREILYIFIINYLFVLLVVALLSNFDIIYGLMYPEMEPLLDFTPTYMDPLSFIMEVITSIIAAPILEELLFRGVFFNRLKIRTGIIAAMIISSALFAIGHEFGGMTSAFLFGICMCIIYLKTDNILMTISIHFLNNLLAVILEVANADAFLFQMPLVPITGIVSVIAGLLIIVYIFEETKRLMT